MPSQNPGCLTAFLKIFEPKKKREEPEELPYRVRDDFLSDAETSFFHVLKNMIGDHLILFTKVSLSDIFYVTNPQKNMAYYNKINRKHVDFLLCNPKTLAPILAIELDDSSHSQPKRMERDAFVDQVYKTANLPLLHIPVQRSYNTKEIGAFIKEALQSNSPEDKVQKTTQAQPESMDTPLCPKCGIPMVKRIAKSGRHAGEKFYGCPNYPKCKEIIFIDGEAS